MTTQDVANKLIELCVAQDWETADNTLYHQDIESNEPNPEWSTKGLVAKKEKTANHAKMVTYKATRMSEPLISGPFIAVRLEADWINHYAGDIEETIEELCVYQVKDGKIWKEWFYADMPERSEE